MRLTHLHNIIFPETYQKIMLHITCIHSILGGNQLAPLEPITDRKITRDTEINLTYHHTQKHMECRGVCSGLQLIMNKVYSTQRSKIAWTHLSTGMSVTKKFIYSKQFKQVVSFYIGWKLYKNRIFIGNVFYCR